MGYADQKSGSISPTEAEQVLKRMHAALSNQKAKSTTTTNNQGDESFGDAPVSLGQRALPLMELLEFAVKEEHPVSWRAS